MTILDDGPRLRETVATACRVLAQKGLVGGVLGHVSARVSPNEMVIRCRGPQEQGLAKTTAADVWRITLDGEHRDLPEAYSPPSELSLHTELLRQRPSVGAVVHAHPHSALLCGLAGLRPRAVFGAYNIPAMRLAIAGVPVFPRPVLIRRRELALEMIEAMGNSDVCLLRGHGITVAGDNVEQATVKAVNLHVLLEVTVQLAQLGANPPEIEERDLVDLPDLGSAFNDTFAWQALVAELTIQSPAQ
jgi:ribulose-5-phosphate 4-epimerase/fuculose-1-phosphate aldolase